LSASAEFAATPDNADAFAAWAEVYDRQDNPLLSLEERYLPCLLPDSKGRDLLDVGCGTGRWLTRLAQAGPASLYGLDSSRKMLEVAAAKHLANVRLDYAELPSLPVASKSMDLVLASFVLSYVEDLEQCASELARAMRSDGDLYISDMHPDTAVALGWNRGFDRAGLAYRLATQTRPLASLIDTFSSNGFSLAARIEPPFGELERELFQVRGKEAAWRQAMGMPAIYLLHFRRLPIPPSHSVAMNAPSALSLSGAQCAFGGRALLAASVTIENSVIASIMTKAAPKNPGSASDTYHIDLDGYLLFPGLVNSHDHLEFALFSRLGSPPYENATKWASDIQANEAGTIALHKKVPKDVRLWWGGIRNLLCGATTVCQHNPLDPVLQTGDFPVRVVAKYGWEHSLAFAKDISAALGRTGDDEPFFIHACEGIDRISAEELLALDAMGALEERSVLVHGLALDEAGAALLNERRSALIVCPSSNSFLFQRTHTLKLLHSIERLALGSDSPLTANGDLLDEIRFARVACDLHANELYDMVTDRAARIVRLDRGEGTLRIRSVADLFALRHRAGSPAEILAEATWRDVELVFVGGQVQLASSEIFDRLPMQMKRELNPMMVEDELRWLRAPVSALLEATESVLGTGNVHVGGLRISRV
jgi:cytosine/adenosine deaminase-related metal-dependent hydrolase/ubiquinone/menaquinone biosynthesis C-methylase UbiE